jgi:signal transduction histidine kinase
MPHDKGDTRIVLLVIGLAVALFVLDLALPLGVAAGAPYVAVVMVAGWSSNARFPLYVATGCAVLTVCGFFLSPPGVEIWKVAVNRGLSIFAIGSTGWLAWLRRGIEEQRREEHRLLKAAYEELDAFVRTVSHDLRGSLTPIIGYADYLRTEYEKCLGESGCNAARAIGTRGKSMLVLMEDLLTLSRVGHLPPPEQPQFAAAAVQAALRTLEGYDAVELRLASLPSVRVPATLLEQLFANLLSNAFRYAGAKGAPIEIGGKRQGDRVVFWVCDHGPGIPASERQRIFEVFYRGSAGEGLSGTGVGLATVKKIARLFDGHAWVEETPGGGATFKIEMRGV